MEKSEIQIMKQNERAYTGRGRKREDVGYVGERRRHGSMCRKDV